MKKEYFRSLGVNTQWAMGMGNMGCGMWDMISEAYVKGLSGRSRKGISKKIDSDGLFAVAE